LEGAAKAVHVAGLKQTTIIAKFRPVPAAGGGGGGRHQRRCPSARTTDGDPAK
jgi:hypothetical protein